ncbi:MAG: hypothetical protein Q4D89_03930 [Arachnia propionica]|uniref:hypothetical protein n=1 Tax=Arachnia propionica TaxID=1750 RepID=UPI00270C68F5|nr:hypothetical protein [Arachnia propionica]
MATTQAPLVARGVALSPVPKWATSEPQQLAAEFVRIAATPDTRLDDVPEAAWQRAAHLMATPIPSSPSTEAPSWWRQLVRVDGFISIEISNVVGGGEPQAAPGPEELHSPTPADDEVELEVMFTQAQRAEGHSPRKGTQVHVWVVQVRDGKVTGFTPES